MKITYNAPFTLTFTFVAIAVMFFSDLTAGHSTFQYFSLLPNMPLNDPMTYFRLFSHVIGHINWEHLGLNFMFILVLGPILEEKYGTKMLLILSLLTAVITAILNNLFFSTGLLGASGIAFMMIILSSITNVKAGKIPLTFILIAFLFLLFEVSNMMTPDDVSQFAHIVGGVCGGIFGFLIKEGEE